MTETLDGFLITRQWSDITDTTGNTHLQLSFWLTTSQGPVLLRYINQPAVFFIESSYIEQARYILSSQLSKNGWRDKPITLKTFQGNTIHAVYFNQQRLLYDARKLLKEQGIVPLEADIQPTDRFLMERFITGTFSINGIFLQKNGFLETINPKVKPSRYQPSYTILSLDIETAITGNQLYSIGLISTSSSTPQQTQQYVFMLGNNDCHTTKPDYLCFCHDETALMTQFISTVQTIDPDIIIGWNVINFDFRFLQRVADRLQIPLKLGRNNTLLNWRQSRTNNDHYTLTLPGRLVLDGIDTLKSATYNFESFSLEKVANEVLQRGKLIQSEDNRGKEITRLFTEDKVALAAYNLEDCQLVWDIFLATELIEFAIERAQLTGLAMDRFGGSVAAFDNRYLPRLHRAGYVAPNIPDNPQGVGSPGGYVMDSFPGIYNHVLVLDFKSLYPSIIRTFKIDPLGLIKGIESCQTTPKTDKAETSVENKEKLVPGFNGAVFSKQENILPDIIGELWAARDEAKLHNHTAMSQAIKILMNSFYGVLGTPGCRFFDYRLPSSITLRGHFILYKTKALIEQKGYQVIYGDTDSVFVSLKGYHPNIASETIKDIGKQLAKELNQWWADYLYTEYQIKSFLEIQFETHFKRFIMPTIRGSEKGSKKRYAGLAINKNNESELIFKGLETVRTDWTPLAREFQRELYRRIFHNELYQDYIRSLIADIYNGQKDNLLVYRKRIRRKLADYQKNIPPHVQAAKLAELRRQQENKLPKYHRGGWIEYCLTTSGPEPVEYLQSALDYDLYIERQIMPIADSILHFLDTSFSEVVDKQIGLF
ncbi:DNA polymerase II [Spartinivicinus poritis]|uniref:DNA polymerase n=1 Tax=Spartinivicinus poritis TaxID=2994640 RepID=A0ABT5U6C3_9GAMM|nr:DNA polymerase II [Spartinivicinus sp. A2-2]MDE1461903.1 DNA polymerase II [Spartinivicinus sp. A2-2]